MKRIIYSSILLCSLFCLNSCKKDAGSSPASNGLQGKYNFISLTGTTVSTEIVTDGTTTDKTITTSNFISKNTTGTLTIDATNITSANVAYSIDTTAHAVFYEDGILVDTEDFPYQAAVPPSGATAGYKLVSSDSLYFPNGSIIDGTSTSTAPEGARIKLEGNKLTVYGAKETTTQDTQSGNTITLTTKANIIAVYQK